MRMRLPYSDLAHAMTVARQKAQATGDTWYVNRLASSGPMRYEVADVPITDTSFGGSVIVAFHPAAAEVPSEPA